jgi:hypothetical protein
MGLTRTGCCLPDVLDGGSGRGGVVFFDEASIEAYLERHSFGVVGRTFYRIFYRIIQNGSPRSNTSEHPQGHESSAAPKPTRRERDVILITRRSQVQILPPPPTK